MAHFPAWQLAAACRDADPEIFFPTGDPADPFDERNLDALTWCEACPVRAQCLDFALDAMPYGIAGGMTAGQRARYRAHRQRRAADAPRPSAPTAAPDPNTRAGVRARGVELLDAGEQWGKIAEQLNVSYRSVERWAAERGISAPRKPSPHPLSARQARQITAGSRACRPTNLARRISA